MKIYGLICQYVFSFPQINCRFDFTTYQTVKKDCCFFAVLGEQYFLKYFTLEILTLKKLCKWQLQFFSLSTFSIFCAEVSLYETLKPIQLQGCTLCPNSEVCMATVENSFSLILKRTILNVAPCMR